MARSEYETSQLIAPGPAVSVVIPHWNKKAYIGPCLDALAQQTYLDFEIIVIDHGSTDGSADFIAEHYPEVVLLKRDRNYGFTGVNAGMRVARGTYVALLNNDAQAEPGWLAALVARMEQDGKTGMVTSKILQLHGEGERPVFDSTGDFYHVWGRPHPRARDEEDRGQYDQAEEVFGASGGATLYRVSMLREIGLFDEEFFAYYEDVDLSFRARLGGYTVWYEPRAVVNHRVGGTSGGGKSALSRYHSVKNQWYVYLRNLPASLFWKYLPRFLFMQILFFGSAVLTGLAWPHIKSVLRGMLMTPYMLRERWRIQRARRITPAQLDRWLLKEIPDSVGPNFHRYFGWLMGGRRAG